MASASDHRAHAALQPADCLILLPQRLPAAVETSIGSAHYPAECTQSDAFLQPSLRARNGRANSDSFHDRVSLVYDSVPAGYFSVFKEIADIVVTLISEGVAIGQSFIPDISVGQHWSKFWSENDFETSYGHRRKYEHNYPLYFPQADSNPQLAFCYADSALG